MTTIYNKPTLDNWEDMDFYPSSLIDDIVPTIKNLLEFDNNISLSLDDYMSYTQDGDSDLVIHETKFDKDMSKIIDNSNNIQQESLSLLESMIQEELFMKFSFYKQMFENKDMLRIGTMPLFPLDAWKKVTPSFYEKYSHQILELPVIKTENEHINFLFDFFNSFLSSNLIKITNSMFTGTSFKNLPHIKKFNHFEIFQGEDPISTIENTLNVKFINYIKPLEIIATNPFLEKIESNTLSDPIFLNSFLNFINECNYLNHSIVNKEIQESMSEIFKNDIKNNIKDNITENYKKIIDFSISYFCLIEKKLPENLINFDSHIKKIVKTLNYKISSQILKQYNNFDDFITYGQIQYDLYKNQTNTSKKSKSLKF